MSNDRFAGNNDLHNEADDGNHSQSAIFDLFEFEIFDLVGSTDVHRIESVVRAGRIRLLESDQFNKADCDNDLNPSCNRNGIDCLEWIGFREKWIRQVNDFLNKHTKNGQHANSTMFQFRSGGIVKVDIA